MEKIYHQLVQRRKGYKNTVDTVHMLLRGYGGGLEPCCAWTWTLQDSSQPRLLRADREVFHKIRLHFCARTYFQLHMSH